MSLVWGTNGKWAVQRVQCRRVETKLGRKVCLPMALEKATWATMRLHVILLCGPGDKISLVLKDWELAKVALSCYMALGHDVPGNAGGLVAGLPLPRGRLSLQERLSLTVDGQGEGCGWSKERKKERERRALLS